MNVVEECRCCGHAGSATHVLDVASTDTDHRFAIARCGGCGVLQTRPVPADLSPYYATDLAATMTLVESPIFTALRRLVLARELQRIVKHGDPGTLLDVGCGAGDFARVIADRGLPVVAADAREPHALSSAPAALRGIPYAHFDFETYELSGLSGREASGRFTVILRHVLEHVRDPCACLASLRRQGARRFYIVVPNAASRERRMLGADWYLWDPPRHLWHFDATSLAALCDRAGLAIVDRGFDTAPTLVPSLYRRLRLRGWPPALYRRFGPTSAIAALSMPLNLLVPGNVRWVVARAAP